MILRFIAFALTLLLLTPGSVLSVMADDVGLSAAERAKNIKAYQARKAQGLETDTSRGGRGAAHQPQRAQKLNQQQQAMERARRCQDAMNDAQNTAMGASVASSVIGFIPFGGVASSVVGAAAGVGSAAAAKSRGRKWPRAADQSRCRFGVIGPVGSNCRRVSGHRISADVKGPSHSVERRTWPTGMRSNT